jgi:hypothetical protein
MLAIRYKLVDATGGSVAEGESALGGEGTVAAPTNLDSGDS